MTDMCYNFAYSCYETPSTIPWDTIIAFAGILMAIWALWLSVRLQIISFIEAQLVEIAKTCNSYLQHDYQVNDENGIITRGRASGIVTALEDAEIIIKNYYNKKRLIIFKHDVENFKQVFFNHLHSSIKEVLKDVWKNKESQGFTYWKEGQDEQAKQEIYDPIRKDQLDSACDFFEKQIRNTSKFQDEREKRLGIK